MEYIVVNWYRAEDGGGVVRLGGSTSAVPKGGFQTEIVTVLGLVVESRHTTLGLCKTNPRFFAPSPRMLLCDLQMLQKVHDGGGMCAAGCLLCRM